MGKWNYNISMIFLNLILILSNNKFIFHFDLHTCVHLNLISTSLKEIVTNLGVEIYTSEGNPIKSIKI